MTIQSSDYVNNNVITITLASLANEAIAVSSTVNNSINKFISADIQIVLKTTTPTLVIGVTEVYFLRSADGGTTFDDSAVNAEIIGVYSAAADNTFFVFSVPTALNGQLPDFWKIAIKNRSGAAFDATAGNFSVKFLGKRAQDI
jgi:hypothetical protein